MPFFKLIMYYQMISPEHRHMCNIIETDSVVFRYLGMCMFIHMHTLVAKIHVKRSHRYEREQGGLHGKVWRETENG